MLLAVSSAAAGLAFSLRSASFVVYAPRAGLGKIVVERAARQASATSVAVTQAAEYARDGEPMQVREALLEIGKSRRALAKSLGVSLVVVQAVWERRYSTERRKRNAPTAAVDLEAVLGKREFVARYEPTPEEIEAACAKLRAAKPTGDVSPWHPPGCDRPLAAEFVR